MVVMRWAKFQMWDVRKRDQIRMEECTLRQPYLLSFWKIGTFLWKIEFRQFLTLGHTTSCNKSVKKANETLLRKTMYTQTENGTDSIWIMRTPLHQRPIKCFQMRLIYTTIIKKIPAINIYAKSSHYLSRFLYLPEHDLLVADLVELHDP